MTTLIGIHRHEPNQGWAPALRELKALRSSQPYAAKEFLCCLLGIRDEQCSFLLEVIQQDHQMELAALHKNQINLIFEYWRACRSTLIPCVLHAIRCGKSSSISEEWITWVSSGELTPSEGVKAFDFLLKLHILQHKKKAAYLHRKNKRQRRKMLSLERDMRFLETTAENFWRNRKSAANNTAKAA